MLAVTCTDMAVLCGNHSEACFGKYGTMPLRGKHCHEFALRMVLACLQTHAARYKRYIVPMVSCSIDFYVRLFVRVYTSPQEVKKSASKLSHVFQCGQCKSFTLHPLAVEKRASTSESRRYRSNPVTAALHKCEHCGGRTKMCGPIWGRCRPFCTWVSLLTAYCLHLLSYRMVRCMTKKLYGRLS